MDNDKEVVIDRKVQRLLEQEFREQCVELEQTEAQVMELQTQNAELEAAAAGMRAALEGTLEDDSFWDDSPAIKAFLSRKAEPIRNALSSDAGAKFLAEMVELRAEIREHKVTIGKLMNAECSESKP